MYMYFLCTQDESETAFGATQKGLIQTDTDGGEEENTKKPSITPVSSKSKLVSPGGDPTSLLPPQLGSSSGGLPCMFIAILQP